MTKQKGNPNRSVAIATAFVVIAISGFAVAFYVLDGMSLAREYLDLGFLFGSDASDASLESSAGVAVAAADTLRLPEGMPEEFALRVWQEQVDSQANLERLVNGEVLRLSIPRVVQGEEASTLDIIAEFQDGTSSRGKLGFRRFGDVWYVSYVTGLREGDLGRPPTGALPSIQDVDVGLLSAILAENAKSASVAEEYATGVVAGVEITGVVQGPDTATLKIEMDETHDHSGYGDVIMVSKTIDGKKHWFIARFTKVRVR